MKNLSKCLCNALAVFVLCVLVLSACKGGEGFEPLPQFEILLEKTELEVGPEKNSYSISVTTSCLWRAYSDVDWIVVDNESDYHSGSGELSFSVQQNDEGSSRRYGGIRIESYENPNSYNHLSITQTAFPRGSVWPNSLIFLPEGGEESISVSADCEYKATTDSEWISIISNNNGYVVSAAVNNSGINRQGKVCISSVVPGFSEEVIVTQASENSIITYTSSDNKVVNPTLSWKFISNTYDNGKGVIIFDAPITSIPESAFRDRGKSLTSITIPNSVTAIGLRAFEECTSLSTFVIPNSVTTISRWAFRYCHFTKLTIPESVTSIDEDAFENMITDELILETKLIESDYGEDYDSRIMMMWLSNMRSFNVIVGNNITYIGKYALFSSPQDVQSITIPNSVAAIGYRAFYNKTCELILDCSKPLEKDYYPKEDNPTDKGWLNGYRGTKVTIGDSVRELGRNLFRNQSSITSMSVGQNLDVSHMGGYWLTSLSDIFIRVDNLAELCRSNGISNVLRSRTSVHLLINNAEITSLTIPASVTSIGWYAFSGCSSLTSVTMPDSVTSIGDSAFNGCTSLTSVTIPDSVTSIGALAFSLCTSLKEVYCKSVTPPAGENEMFDNNASGRKIFVPTASVDEYKSAAYWSDYKNDIYGY